MATRLTLLNAGATRSSRIGAFPTAAESLDDGGRSKAQAARSNVPMADLWYSSPATAARETAMAFGISPKMSDALADLDYGEWSGHSIEELEQAQPEPLGRWFADPGSGAPGGETFGQLVERLAPWIDAQAGSDGSIFAITHATVIRAALVSTMRLPVDATYQIDIAPLGIVTLSYNQKWRLHELRRL